MIGATRLRFRDGFRARESRRRLRKPRVALILPCVLEMRTRRLPLAPLLLTVPDTARRLRRHEQTIRAMIRRGDLTAIRLGRLVRVFAAAVDQASAAMGRAAVHSPTPRRPLRRLAARARA